VTVTEVKQGKVRFQPGDPCVDIRDPEKVQVRDWGRGVRFASCSPLGLQGAFGRFVSVLTRTVLLAPLSGPKIPPSGCRGPAMDGGFNVGSTALRTREK
jgi:hypothetical protein